MVEKYFNMRLRTKGFRQTRIDVGNLKKKKKVLHLVVSSWNSLLSETLERGQNGGLFSW